MTENRSVLTRPAAPPDAVDRYGHLPDHIIDRWFAEGGSNRPLVVLVHGGFWRPEYDRTHLRPMADALKSAGWDVATIEYRRIPGDPDATTGDVRVACGSFGDRPLVTIGHSAGGHLVLWLAAAGPPPTLAATVALAPVADLTLAHDLGLDGDAVAAFLGGPPDDRADLDPARLPSASTPVTVVHGADDTIVPLAVSEAYISHNPATRLVPVDGVGHYEVIDPQSEAWPIVLGVLELG